MTTVVLTVLGDDRPGLVESLAGLISEHRGNWSRSEMARLGGKFAGIVEASVPDGSIDALRDGLDALAATGLHTTLTLAGSDVPVPGERVFLSLVGTDQPGLLHAVAGALASVGASIEELGTSVSDAPMAGGTMFEASAVVVLPDGISLHDVRDRLEALAAHLMVDIAVEG